MPRPPVALAAKMPPLSRRLAERPLLHLWAAFVFALAQPLFSLLTDNVPLLVYHAFDPLDLLLLAGFLWLVVPATPAALVALTRRLQPDLGDRLVPLGLGVAAGTFLLVAVKQSAAPGSLTLQGLAVLGGLGVAVGYRRLLPLRLYLTVLALAAPVFLSSFLLHPEVRPLLDPDPTELRASPGPPSTPSPVVLIVFDGLPLVSLVDRDYEIDASLFPNFAELAGQSTWYRNASTVHAYTVQSIAAILTGLRPEPKARPTLESFPQNLFTLLEPSHQLVIREQVTRLAPPAVRGSQRPRAHRLLAVLSDLRIVYLHLVIPEGLSRNLPPIDETWGDFARFRPEGESRLDGRAAEFRAFLAGIEPTERPPLYYNHVGLPHLPWRYLPSGRLYPGLPPEYRAQLNPWRENPRYALVAYQRHLLQLLFVDRLLGELMDRLRDLSLWDDSLVAITSDHGACFWPGEARRNPGGTDHFEDIIRIPLFVKAPGQRASRVDDRNVETIDLLPTLADHLGLEIPGPLDGHSTIRPDFPERELKRVATSREELHFPGLFSPDLRTVHRMQDLFPPSAGEHRFYSIGPYPSLVGRSLSGLNRQESSRCAASLGPPELHEHLREETVLPALVSGMLRDPEAPGQPAAVAVSLDGRIEGVGETAVGPEGLHRFFLFLREEALLSTPETPEVYRIRGPATDPTLIACAQGERP